MELQVRRALVSVYDKTGIAELGTALARRGVTVLSTGGSATALRQAGVDVLDVAEYTGFPEMMDGRVKTLHPRIHAGLLARRDREDDRRSLEEHDIAPIDLVVVNLYPFAAGLREGRPFDEQVELIDIGGPSLVRAAAKNHAHVAVVTDAQDYSMVLAELDRGGITEATRRWLAAKAFAATWRYDAEIAGWLAGAASETPSDAEMPQRLGIQLELVEPLRYGENPHQRAAWYRSQDDGFSLAAAERLQGKQLSYNNLLDLDAAWALVGDLPDPGAAVIKHNNPSGAATGRSLVEAYVAARECDPVSAFGSVVALSREVDVEVAGEIASTFVEAVIAPSFTAAARERLAKKKNLRLLATHTAPARPAGLELRRIAGGMLVQDVDGTSLDVRGCRVVTRRAPTEEEWAALDFSWRVAKHVRSNAIVFADATRTLGIGAGQMSRVDSVQLAVTKAQSELKGSAVASDAFFPFRDGLDAAAAAGATCAVQPGGSKRDPEVIAAADEHGMAMVLTGERHFRH